MMPFEPRSSFCQIGSLANITQPTKGKSPPRKCNEELSLARVRAVDGVLFSADGSIDTHRQQARLSNSAQLWRSHGNATYISKTCRAGAAFATCLAAFALTLAFIFVYSLVVPHVFPWTPHQLTKLLPGS